MNLQDLKLKREELRKDAKKVLDGARTERDLGRVDEIQEEIAELDTKIKDREKEREREIELETRDRAGLRVAGGPANGAAYRDMFGKPRTDSQWESLDEFVNVLTSQRHDPRLEERAHIAGEGEAGGFSVPEEFGELLADAALEEEIVRPRATVWPMGTSSRKVPAWNGLDRSKNLYGGFKGAWLGEAEEADTEQAELRQIKLKAEKLGIYTQLSRELREDGMGFEQQLQQAMRQAAHYFMDEAFIAGDGVAKPLGLLNDPALITVDRDTGSQIAYTDVINVYSRLYKGGRSGSKVWIANHETLPQLMLMKDEDNNAVWQPNAREGAPGELLGIPVLLSEKNPELGEVGDLILANLDHYAIGMRQEIDLDVSLAPGWYKDLVDLRVILRVDGQGTWDKPLTPRQGSDTMSWVVAIAE